MTRHTSRRRKKALPERVLLALWELALLDEKPSRHIDGGKKQEKLVMRPDLLRAIKVRLEDLKVSDRKVRSALRSLETNGHITLSRLDPNSCWVVMPSQEK